MNKKRRNCHTEEETTNNIVIKSLIHVAWSGKDRGYLFITLSTSAKCCGGFQYSSKKPLPYLEMKWIDFHGSQMRRGRFKIQNGTQKSKDNLLVFFTEEFCRWEPLENARIINSPRNVIVVQQQWFCCGKPWVLFHFSGEIYSDFYVCTYAIKWAYVSSQKSSSNCI